MISLIAARANNGVIGYKNQMPWHIPEELKYFRRITSGHTIIMGRNTLLSIGKPLPNRRNIVITSDKSFEMKGIEVVHSVEQALALTNVEDEFFVIGGKMTYEQFLPYADKIYLTEIHHEFKGDTYFPSFNEDDWKIISSEKGLKDEKNNYDYFYQVLIKK